MLINDAGGERYRRMDGKNGSIAELPNNSYYSGSQRIYDLDSEYALKFRAQKQRVHEMQDMKKQIESALEKPSYALLEKLCEVINDGVENEQEQQWKNKEAWLCNPERYPFGFVAGLSYQATLCWQVNEF